MRFCAGDAGKLSGGRIARRGADTLPVSMSFRGGVPRPCALPRLTRAHPALPTSPFAGEAQIRSEAAGRFERILHLSPGPRLLSVPSAAGESKIHLEVVSGAASRTHAPYDAMQTGDINPSPRPQFPTGRCSPVPPSTSHLMPAAIRSSRSRHRGYRHSPRTRGGCAHPRLAPWDPGAGKPRDGDELASACQLPAATPALPWCAAPTSNISISPGRRVASGRAMRHESQRFHAMQGWADEIAPPGVRCVHRDSGGSAKRSGAASIAQGGIGNFASRMPPQVPSGAVAPGSLIRIRGASAPRRSIRSSSASAAVTSL